MHEIVVVVLKMKTMHDILTMTEKDVDLVNHFKQLSAVEKIDLIKDKIKKLCQILLEKEPKAMWIITWHEHMINNGENNRAIDKEAKEKLKNVMQELEKEFSPHLTIIAGATSTKKRVSSNPDKFKKLKENYERLNWVSKIEEERATALGDTRQVQLINELNNIKQVETQTFPYFDIIRNTCYIFHKGKILRHDKIVPSQECFFNEEKNTLNPVFQTGNEKNSGSFFCFTHPITGYTFWVGVEICREHTFSILKRQLAQPCLLQLIMSNTIPLKIDNACADFVTFADSVKPSRFICREEKINELIKMNAYNFHILNDKNSLALEPIRQENQFASKPINQELEKVEIKRPIKN